MGPAVDLKTVQIYMHIAPVKRKLLTIWVIGVILRVRRGKMMVIEGIYVLRAVNRTVVVCIEGRATSNGYARRILEDAHYKVVKRRFNIGWYDNLLVVLGTKDECVADLNTGSLITHWGYPSSTLVYLSTLKINLKTQPLFEYLNACSDSFHITICERCPYLRSSCRRKSGPRLFRRKYEERFCTKGTIYLL